MPAGSDPATAPVPLPRTWRPLGPRVAGIAGFAMLLVVMGFLWAGFDDETRASVTPFQRGTVFAVALLGAAVVYALARSRAVAQADRLVVVNGYRRHVFAWEQVLAVRMPPGAPWATLDLADGTTASVMAIQGSDGERARRAVRELRGLIDRPVEGGPQNP